MNVCVIAGQDPPPAALAADKTSVVSAAKTSVVSAAKKAATSAATSDISMKSTTPRGRLRRPRGVVDEIEMSDVAADVAAFLAADTTDVLSAAKGVCVWGVSIWGCYYPYYPDWLWLWL